MIPRDFQPFHSGRRFSSLSCEPVCKPTVSRPRPSHRVEAISIHAPFPAHRFWSDALSHTRFRDAMSIIRTFHCRIGLVEGAGLLLF